MGTLETEPSETDRRRHVERLANRMIKLRCITLAARARGDMPKFYKGNMALFNAQDKFQEGELGAYLRKEAGLLN
ncbi:MAG: hypothetical protein AAB573_01480 [Patescibacteria group bacterium]